MTLAPPDLLIPDRRAQNLDVGHIFGVDYRRGALHGESEQQEAVKSHCLQDSLPESRNDVAGRSYGTWQTSHSTQLAIPKAEACGPCLRLGRYFWA